MVITTVRVQPRPEKRREILQVLMDLCEQIMRHEGCVSSSVFQDLEDAGSFYMIKQWKSFYDLEKHKKSKDRSILLGLNSLLTEALDFRYAKRL